MHVLPDVYQWIAHVLLGVFTGARVGKGPFEWSVCMAARSSADLGYEI